MHLLLFFSLPAPRRLAGLFMLAAILPARADELAATPYRPTVSDPAKLPVPGWLEVESGVQNSREPNGRQQSLPYLLKLAFSDRFGVLLGGDAYLSALDDKGNRKRGFGDTSLTLKGALPVSKTTMLGLELGNLFPSSPGGIGNARADYTANGILSTDLANYHLDINLNVTRLGDPQGAGRLQGGWAASLSRDLGEKLNAAAEFSGTNQHNATPTAKFLTALSYAQTPKVVWDAGASHGLNRESEDWALFAGVTVLAQKLF